MTTTSFDLSICKFLNLIGDLVVTCGYLTVLALLFFQIEIFPVIFNIFLNIFFLYICARTSMMPPWVLASQLVYDKVVKFNQEKSMHPWNVGVVLQYSRKWWTIKVFQEWKQFTLLRWMKTKYFCERFQQPLTAHFGLNALLWCTSSDFFLNTEVDPSPFFSHWRVQGVFDAWMILNFCWNKLWKSFHHLLLFIIYKDGLKIKWNVSCSCLPCPQQLKLVCKCDKTCLIQQTSFHWWTISW